MLFVFWAKNHLANRHLTYSHLANRMFSRHRAMTIVCPTATDRQETKRRKMFVGQMFFDQKTWNQIYGFFKRI